MLKYSLEHKELNAFLKHFPPTPTAYLNPYHFMAVIKFTNSSGMPTLSYYMQDTVRGLLRETTINNTRATAGDSDIFQIVISLGNFPSQVRRHIYTVTSMCLFVTRLGLGFWKLFHNR